MKTTMEQPTGGGPVNRLVTHIGATLKAYVASLASGGTALLAEWSGDDDPLTPRDFVVALVAALITWGAVYKASNTPADEEEPKDSP